MGIKNKLISYINKLPYVRGLYKSNLEYLNFTKNSCFTAGHFHSPIINIDEIKERENEIWTTKVSDTIEGIDLNTTNQIQLVKKMEIYYSEMPFLKEKQKDLKYYFENDFYSYTDGITLYSVIREFKPKNIIEIGSGYSSALMLDTNKLFFKDEINLTFIEPNTERLLSLLNNQDNNRATIIQSIVQLVPLSKFKELNKGDILFIDSSHIVKTDSDLNHILFKIIPILKPGVIIHFHDIFYPFEYPKEWVYKGRNWNENYFLRSFLMYNNSFKILLFSEYLHQTNKEVFINMPLCYLNTGGNLWIEKIKS
jgi:predicted O-methyltransferase YrrM